METPSNSSYNEPDFKSSPHIIKELSDQVRTLKEENAMLRSEIVALKARLTKDSHNSSKPPSSDGLKKKTINLRKSSGKKPGGQPGYKGSTLRFDGPVDKTMYYLPETPCGCGLEYEITASSTHYVIDLPKDIRPEVTAHHTHSYRCPGCGMTTKDPVFQGSQVQYGHGVKSLSMYLKNYQLLPYNRIKAFFQDCFNFPISVASLANFEGQAKEGLSPFQSWAKTNLQASEVLHSDETGLRVEGKLHWMHVASNDEITCYHLDKKRGKEAIERAGILPDYEGTLVHDRFASYFNYGYDHGLCNAHILRELIYIKENDHATWAQTLIDLLLHAKQKAAKGEPFAKGYITKTKNRFKAIVRQELTALNQKEKEKKPIRGKLKRSEAHNLLRALNKYHREVLAFLTNSVVPFDNNLAERDLRMIKTRQKISGCFRSVKSGKAFASIRGYISTLNKQNINVLEGLQTLFSAPQDVIYQFDSS